MSDDSYKSMILSVESINKEIRKIEADQCILIDSSYGKRFNNENIYYINRQIIKIREQCKILKNLIEQTDLRIDGQGDSKNAR